MPPGFGVLDTMLVSFPFMLMLLGLIRGAPVELASGCGCAAGVAVAWFVSQFPLAPVLGHTGALVAALSAGLLAWRIARRISERLGFDTRWVQFGRLFDTFAGGVMGGLRGVAMVSAGCLSYAMIFVPLGLADPLDTVVYPVLLSVGSRATSAVIGSGPPEPARLPEQSSPRDAADMPQPMPPPASQPGPAARPQPQLAPPPIQTAQAPTGAALASLLHVLVPPAAAATVQPAQIPPGLREDTTWHRIRSEPSETHHNLRNPFGTWTRRIRH